jgi:hypothetical protein
MEERFFIHDGEELSNRVIWTQRAAVVGREGIVKLRVLVLLLPVSLITSDTAPSEFISSAAIGPLTMVCFCHPSPPPYLFGPRSLVERAWSRDGAHNCRGQGGKEGAVCDYRSGSMHVAVTYASKNQAVKFDLFKANNSIRTRNWAFLVALLPKRARLTTCGALKNSNQGGPAKVCRYRYAFKYSERHLLHQGHTLVVAQYFHPHAGGQYGVVEPDAHYLAGSSPHRIFIVSS